MNGIIQLQIGQFLLIYLLLLVVLVVMRVCRIDQTRLLVVVMGGRSRAARDMVAHSLIEAGFKAPASPQQVRKRMRGVL